MKKKIRKEWNEDEQDWYVSVVDIIGALTDQPTQRNASTYWAVMKKRLLDEGASELLTNCKQLKMKAADGKMRMTDIANTKEILRDHMTNMELIHLCKDSYRKQIAVTYLLCYYILC